MHCELFAYPLAPAGRTEGPGGDVRHTFSSSVEDAARAMARRLSVKQTLIRSVWDIVHMCCVVLCVCVHNAYPLVGDYNEARGPSVCQQQACKSMWARFGQSCVNFRFAVFTQFISTVLWPHTHPPTIWARSQESTSHSTLKGQRFQAGPDNNPELKIMGILLAVVLEIYFPNIIFCWVTIFSTLDQETWFIVKVSTFVHGNEHCHTFYLHD